MQLSSKRSEEYIVKGNILSYLSFLPLPFLFLSSPLFFCLTLNTIWERQYYKLSMPLATALIIAAATYAAKAKSDDVTDENDSSNPENITPAFVEGKTPIELLPLEQKLTIFEHPIATISFYDCASLDSNDLTVVIGKLENRVKDIVKANPWLGGWLISGKGIGSFDKTHRLWYDPSGEEMAPGIFQEIAFKDVPVGRSTPFVEYETILCKSSALVKNNPLIVNRKEEPLFRVRIIPEPDERALDGVDSLHINGFALVVSMSHVCGDAHTYYRIQNMILGKEHITALIPQRELSFSQKVTELMGRQEAHYVSHVTTDPAWAKLFRTSSSADEDPESELKGRVFTIDKNFIGNIKAMSMVSGNVADLTTSVMRSPMSNANRFELDSIQNPTQSTNDILVSWFWNEVKPDVGMMAVNLRDRVQIISNNHVGNYNNPISYTPEDYKSPMLIRESLKQCRRSGVSESGAPTVLPRASPDTTFSIVTNWSSFRPLAQNQISEDESKDISGWNCNNGVTFLRHLPLIYPRQMIKTMPKRMSFMIIFSSGQDVGCVVIAPNRVMQEIDLCGLVQGMIAQF